MNALFSSILSCSLVLSTMACTHEVKPAVSANAASTSSIASSSVAPGARAIALSDSLRRTCGIEDTGTAPRFEFDAAVLTPNDRAELDQLAKCMTAGPLVGKNVALVGRADARGEAEYNMNLGARRAEAVEHYLAELGVSPNRLPTTSRGALDARGTDEATWALDRRVDLELAGR